MKLSTVKILLFVAVLGLAACDDRETATDNDRTVDTGTATGNDAGTGGTDTNSGGTDTTSGGTDTTSGGGTFTVFDLQDESRPNHPSVGTDVIVTGTVTAVDRLPYDDDPETEGSFWIQDPAGGPYSGIFVFNQGNRVDTTSLQVGQSVAVTGDYSEQFGLSEIFMLSFDIVDTNLAPLTPASVTPADVVTNGSMAEAYEGVLVDIGAVDVTGTDAFANFIVDSGLLIGPDLYDADPFPGEGVHFDSIVGVLTLSFDNVELWPRSAADLGQ